MSMHYYAKNLTPVTYYGPKKLPPGGTTYTIPDFVGATVRSVNSYAATQVQYVSFRVTSAHFRCAVTDPDAAFVTLFMSFNGLYLEMVGKDYTTERVLMGSFHTLGLTTTIFFQSLDEGEEVLFRVKDPTKYLTNGFLFYLGTPSGVAIGSLTQEIPMAVYVSEYV